MLIALSSSSCSSKKKKYEVIKETDPWYEVTSFETGDLYPSDKYEYSWFEVVGASEDSVYLMSEASKYYSGDYSKLTDEELLKLYDQSILRYSYDGKLLEKTNAISYENGKFRTVQKAWISDGKLNLLERVIERNGSSESDKGYLLNGEELTVPDPRGGNEDRFSIEDLYTTNGYKLFSLYDSTWQENILFVVRPDGTQYEPEFYDLFRYGYSNIGEILPSDNGKAIIQVIAQNELVYVQLDLATGEVSELKGLYGSEETYMLEYCNGKTLSRDFHGLNLVDPEAGTLKQIFDYGDVDESFYDIIDTQTLYVSDDGNDIVLGGYVYDNSGFYSTVDNYKIMHLKKADRNPNAGKTVITMSLGEDSYPEYSDLYAAKIYNRQDNPCFVKFVMPYDDSGDYQDADADITLLYNPVSDPSDSSRYLDLAPYFNFNESSYKQEYFSNALEASMSGNSLYRMPLDISASGIITDSSNVPSGKLGFTFDEYKKFLNDKCNGVDPISKTKGFEMSKPEYFTKLFLNMSDNFIKDGKVDLQSEDFRNLMLFVDEYGSDVTSSTYDLGFGYITEHNRAVAEVVTEIDTAITGKPAEVDGKIGAVYGNFYSFENYLDRYKLFGSSIGVYGLPSYDGRGPLTVSSEFVSISADTKFPDACADFVKLLLSYDVQCYKESNPINRKALRHIAEKKLDFYNASIDEESKSDIAVKKAKLTTDAIDKYEEILSSSYGGISAGSSFENILIEESSSYFNGQKSMDDVITVMQKRLQTVLDEAK